MQSVTISQRQFILLCDEIMTTELENFPQEEEISFQQLGSGR